MEDDILREILAYRDAYAAQFNYDVDAMHRDLLTRQGESGHRVVSFAEPRPEPSPEVESESRREDDTSRLASETRR